MRKTSDMWARAAFYATLGFIIPASAVAGYFIGHFLDNYLHTGVALSLVGIFAGTAAGIVEVLMLITRQEKNAGNGRDNGAD
ncbi:MAG: AtpZ/AtpI family protein [Terriglobia bacterium]